MLANLFVQMGLKLLSERVVTKVTVLTLWEISQRTTSFQLDDQIVKAAADQLGVELPDPKKNARSRKP